MYSGRQGSPAETRSGLDWSNTFSKWVKFLLLFALALSSLIPLEISPWNMQLLLGRCSVRDMGKCRGHVSHPSNQVKSVSVECSSWVNRPLYDSLLRCKTQVPWKRLGIFFFRYSLHFFVSTWMQCWWGSCQGSIFFHQKIPFCQYFKYFVEIHQLQKNIMWNGILGQNRQWWILPGSNMWS